jgi:hypothetical protein
VVNRTKGRALHQHTVPTLSLEFLPPVHHRVGYCILHVQVPTWMPEAKLLKVETVIKITVCHVTRIGGGNSVLHHTSFLSTSQSIQCSLSPPSVHSLFFYVAAQSALAPAAPRQYPTGK